MKGTGKNSACGGLWANARVDSRRDSPALPAVKVHVRHQIQRRVPVEGSREERKAVCSKEARTVHLPGLTPVLENCCVRDGVVPQTVLQGCEVTQ